MKENSETTSSTPSCSNCFEPFISPNPVTSFNPIQRFPTIDETAVISQFSSVIGDVTISRNVYVAPNVSVRADEGTPFFIGSNTNLQDGVILHGLLNKRISRGGKGYSIFIGNEVTIAHGGWYMAPVLLGTRFLLDSSQLSITPL